MSEKAETPHGDFRIDWAEVEGDLIAAILDPMWLELSAQDSRLATLTPGQRAVYSLMWLEAEVDNGSFDQFLTNTTGALLPAAQDALRLLRTGDEWTSLLADVADLVGEPFPLDRDLRTDRLYANDDFEGRIDDLTSRFYALDERPETALRPLLESFVEAHPEQFFRASE